MNLNPINAIVTVYRNIKSALNDPDSRVNLIGWELELREEEKRMAANTPNSHDRGKQGGGQNPVYTAKADV